MLKVVKNLRNLRHLLNCSHPQPQLSLLSPHFTNEILCILNKSHFHQSPSLLGVTEVKMPSLSPTMTEGTIVKWLKNEGDSIAPGDVLCEIQTDKAVVSLEFDEEGVLAKVLKPENEADVKVGTLIALVVEAGEDWKNVQIPQDTESSQIINSSKELPNSVLSDTMNKTISTKSADVLIGPAVRNLLHMFNLNYNQIPPSGAHGNILKGDILKEVSSKNLKKVTASPPSSSSSDDKKVSKTMSKTLGGKEKSAPFVDIELTNMRRAIAKRLVQSKSMAHGYLTIDTKLSQLTALRKKLKDVGINVSVNDLVIKCTANAISKVPSVNVVFEGDKVMNKSQIDISFAVATSTGLITPIITNAASKNVIQISEDVAMLASKARNGKLQPQEFMGGTFTISNLGMYGIYNFSGIINPPQSALIAVGGPHPYINESGKIENRINISLSYAPSNINEELGAEFLAHLKHEIECTSEISMGIYSINNQLEMRDLLQA